MRCGDGRRDDTFGQLDEKIGVGGSFLCAFLGFYGVFVSFSSFSVLFYSFLSFFVLFSNMSTLQRCRFASSQCRGCMSRVSAIFVERASLVVHARPAAPRCSSRFFWSCRRPSSCKTDRPMPSSSPWASRRHRCSHCRPTICPISCDYPPKRPPPSKSAPQPRPNLSQSPFSVRSAARYPPDTTARP